MNPIRKILCPTDFSPFSQRALNYALSLAESYKAALYVQHVIEPIPATYFGAGALIAKRQDQEARQAMEDFIPAPARQRLTVVPIIVEGNPHQEILSLVEKERVDLKEELGRLISEHARPGTESMVQAGVAHQEICRTAERLDADLIVMGVSGRGALDTALFGPTTYRTMRAAPCPVLAVR